MTSIRVYRQLGTKRSWMWEVFHKNHYTDKYQSYSTRWGARRAAKRFIKTLRSREEATWQEV